MIEPTLADRMKDYFERQIAWLEQLISGFETLGDDLLSDDLDGLVERQAEEAVKTNDLQEEFRALVKEWEANYTSVPAAQRAEVKALASRAEELSMQLKDLSALAVTSVEGEMARVRDMILKTRRGRDTMNRYAPGMPGDPGFMDKKA